MHDRLDPGLRADLAALSAVHDPGAFRTGAFLSGGDRGIDEMLATAGSAVWPVIAPRSRAVEAREADDASGCRDYRRH